MAALLPNGNIAALAPVYVEGHPEIFGDMGVEITPDDPDYPKWFYFLSDNERARAQAILDEHGKHEQDSPST